MARNENSRTAAPVAVSSTRTPVSDPRVYLASERTFLAWIRTSIALMGFGFVIARFALWTRGYSISGRSTAPSSLGVSTWLGFGMICVGVLVSGLAAVWHRGYIKDLERGVANPPLHISASLILAGILVLVGLLLAILILFL